MQVVLPETNRQHNVSTVGMVHDKRYPFKGRLKGFFCTFKKGKVFQISFLVWLVPWNCNPLFFLLFPNTPRFHLPHFLLLHSRVTRWTMRTSRSLTNDITRQAKIMVSRVSHF